MASLGRLGLLCCCAAGALIAQKVVSARAGLITYLQGSASVDGKRIFLKSTRFPQMRDGEVLSTTGRGRAELLLAPNIILRLAENSQVRMDDTQLSNTRVTLLRGDSIIEIVQFSEGNRIQLELAGTVTEIARPGVYRFGTAQNTLRVYGGEALVRSGVKTAQVKRGMTVDLSPDLMITKFDRKLTDSFHAWAARRSFDLFMGDPEAREKQTHWQYAGAGYVQNKNFDVEFRALIRRGLPPPTTGPSVPRADTH